MLPKFAGAFDAFHECIKAIYKREDRNRFGAHLKYPNLIL